MEKMKTEDEDMKKIARCARSRAIVTNMRRCEDMKIRRYDYMKDTSCSR